MCRKKAVLEFQWYSGTSGLRIGSGDEVVKLHLQGDFFDWSRPEKYGTGPPQQEKMTKYTGPTQDTEDDRVFNKQFLFIKINC